MNRPKIQPLTTRHCQATNFRCTTILNLRYPSVMKPPSPTLEGFRAMFRRPSLGVAEISWRWAFGAAGVALGLLALFEYLNSLPVSRADMFLLRSRHPFLVSQAIGHILEGSAGRVMGTVLILGFALAVAWVAVATLGRAATIKGLLGYFRNDGAGPSPVFRMRSLAALNFLRVAATLAALVGWVGAVLLGAIASPSRNPSPGSAFLLFFAVAMLVAAAWYVVNWFLSLAAVFVLTKGEDAFGALTAAVDLCRLRIGAVLAPSTWFGLTHLVLFFMAASVVAFPLIFAGVLPAPVVFGGVLSITLVYFAIADFLYIGRLAAYISAVEGSSREPESSVPATLPPDNTQPSAANIQPSDRVDQEELILSDVEPIRR